LACAGNEHDPVGSGSRRWAGIRHGGQPLLERFGSVAGIAAADPADWLTVPRIGRERVCALEEIVLLPPGSDAANGPDSSDARS
jgi:hypothetical protein